MPEPVELSAPVFPEVERQRQVCQQVDQHNRDRANGCLIGKEVDRCNPDTRNDDQDQHEADVQEHRIVGHGPGAFSHPRKKRGQQAIARAVKDDARLRVRGGEETADGTGHADDTNDHAEPGNVMLSQRQVGSWIDG